MTPYRSGAVIHSWRPSVPPTYLLCLQGSTEFWTWSPGKKEPIFLALNQENKPLWRDANTPLQNRLSSEVFNNGIFHIYPHTLWATFITNTGFLLQNLPPWANFKMIPFSNPTSVLAWQTLHAWYYKTRPLRGCHRHHICCFRSLESLPNPISSHCSTGTVYDIISNYQMRQKQKEGSSMPGAPHVDHTISALPWWADSLPYWEINWE